MKTFITTYGRIVLGIFGISYVVSFIYFIRDMFLLLIPAIKCRKIKDCLKDDCPFRAGCTHIKFTDKEMIPPWHQDSDEQKKSL